MMYVRLVCRNSFRPVSKRGFSRDQLLAACERDIAGVNAHAGYRKEHERRGSDVGIPVFRGLREDTT
jgi:hypothetical protein